MGEQYPSARAKAVVAGQQALAASRPTAFAHGYWRSFDCAPFASRSGAPLRMTGWVFRCARSARQGEATQNQPVILSEAQAVTWAERSRRTSNILLHGRRRWL